MEVGVKLLVGLSSSVELKEELDPVVVDSAAPLVAVDDDPPTELRSVEVDPTEELTSVE